MTSRCLCAIDHLDDIAASIPVSQLRALEQACPEHGRRIVVRCYQTECTNLLPEIGRDNGLKDDGIFPCSVHECPEHGIQRWLLPPRRRSNQGQLL